MKEALKLFGAMLAIIVSVSAFHDVQPAADASVICQRQLCTSSFDCACGSCVRGQCSTFGGTP
jgi:hypothetical protein